MSGTHLVLILSYILVILFNIKDVVSKLKILRDTDIPEYKETAEEYDKYR